MHEHAAGHQADDLAFKHTLPAPLAQRALEQKGEGDVVRSALDLSEGALPLRAQLRYLRELHLGQLVTAFTQVLEQGAMHGQVIGDVKCR